MSSSAQAAGVEDARRSGPAVPPGGPRGRVRRGARTLGAAGAVVLLLLGVLATAAPGAVGATQPELDPASSPLAPEAPPAPAAPDAPAPQGGAPVCSESSTSKTCTFTTVGVTERFNVPASVHSVTAEAFGAAGGDGRPEVGFNPGKGGKGGSIKGRIAVTPGQELAITVGGQGKTNDVSTGGAGGAGGGGQGGVNNLANLSGCGGGGASRVGLAQPGGGSYDVFIAGGGGGCGGMQADTSKQGANGGDGGGAPRAGVNGPFGGRGWLANCYWAGEGGSPGRALGGGSYSGGAAGRQAQRDSSGCPYSGQDATGGSYLRGGVGGKGECSSGGGCDPHWGGAGGGGGSGWMGGGGGGGGHRTALGTAFGGGGGGGGGVNGYDASPGGGSFVSAATGVQAGDGKVTISWTKDVTQTVLTANPATIDAGHDVTFTATVTVSPTGSAPANDADGKVSFFYTQGFPEESISLCAPTPVVRQSATTATATCTVTRNEAGSIPVQALYYGGTSTRDSSADPLSFTVGKEATRTFIRGYDPATQNLEVWVLGDYSPAVRIGGTVTVADQVGTVCASVPLLQAEGEIIAKGTCLVRPVPGRTRQLTATFSGGDNTFGSTSGVFDLDATVVGTHTELTTSTAQTTFGAPLAATARVTIDAADADKGAVIDGTVTFFDTVDGSPVPLPDCATQPVDGNGSATCALARPIAGTHHLTALYSGGPQTVASSAQEACGATGPGCAVDVRVEKATPRLRVSATPPDGAIAGQQVTLSAGLLITDGVADVAVDEGAVTFTDRPAPDGVDAPIAGCVDVAVHGGAASCPFLPASGSHIFSVSFAGTSNLLAPSTERLTDYLVGLAPTETSLALEPPPTGPIAAGSPITVAATVVAKPTTGSGVPPVPMGRVELFDDGQPVDGCSGPAAVVLDGGGQGRCTYTPSAGRTHALTASFLPTVGTGSAASSTAAPFEVVVGRFASMTTLGVSPDATATTPVFGVPVTLTATVASVGGPAPTGTVRFSDGGVPVPQCDAVAVGTITEGPTVSYVAACTFSPDGGTHHFAAAYSGDGLTDGTDPAALPSLDYTVHAIATTVTAAASASAGGQLTLSALVAPASAGAAAVPTGTVDFSVDGDTSRCQAQMLTPSASGATTVCDWPTTLAAPHTVTVTYRPGAAAANFLAGAPATIQYVPPTQCGAGDVKLWNRLQTASGTPITVSGAPGSLDITAGPLAGPCTPAQPVALTASATGLLTTLAGTGLQGVFVPGTGVCLTDGQLHAPASWSRVPNLDITVPICFTLTANGDLGALSEGEVTATSAAGQFPFVDLKDAPATATSIGFVSDATGSALDVRFLAGTAAEPVLDLRLRVASDGRFSGHLTTPGLSVVGQSLSTLDVTVAGGGPDPLTFNGSVTIGPIAIAGGLVLDAVTVTVSNDGLGIDASGSIGAKGLALAVKVGGTVHDTGDWTLTFSSASSAPWEPFQGFSLSPNVSGTLTRAGGAFSFALTAGTDTGPPLTTWAPAAGAAVVVRCISFAWPASEPVACAGAGADEAWAEDPVLSFRGAVVLAGTTIDIDGSIDLAKGGYHLRATADQVTVTPQLVLTDISLEARGAVGAGLVLSGGASASVKGHDLTVRFDLTDEGTFIIGVQVELSDWGVPDTTGFVAYASGDVSGYDAGGEVGTVDLRRGLTVVGLWKPNGATADLLAKAGLPVSAGAGVRFVASIGPDAVVFVASLGAPDGMPFLTLPGGTSIDSAELTFAREGTPAVTRLSFDVAATVQTSTKVTVHLGIGITEGTFDGEVKVGDPLVVGSGLQLFGLKDILLQGNITGTRDAAKKLVVVARVRGTVPGPVTVVAGPPAVTFRNVGLELGTEGIKVEGDVEVGGQTTLVGLKLGGQIVTKAGPTFPTSGYGAGGWNLTVATTTAVAWTPTDGATFNAVIEGTVTKRSATHPTLFHLTAHGPEGGDLFSVTPSTAPLVLGVTALEVGNDQPARDDCAVTRPGDLWLYVSGHVSLSIGSVKGNAAGSGCYDLTSGELAVTADLADMAVSLPGVTIRGPKVTLARAATTPPPAPGTSRYSVTASVTIEADLLGAKFTSPAPAAKPTTFTAQLTYINGTFVVGVRANLGSYGLGGVGGDAYLYYANAAVPDFPTGDPTIAKVDPVTGIATLGRLDLEQGISFAVRLTLPGSTQQQLNKTGCADSSHPAPDCKGVSAPGGSVTAIGTISAGSFSFKIQFKAGVGGQELFRTGPADRPVRVTLDGGYLKFTVSAGQVSFGLGIEASLYMKPAQGDASSPDVRVRITGELTVSTTAVIVSLSVGCRGSDPWRDAFGVPGLVVGCASFQGGITYAGVPTVGFYGEVTGLPQRLADTIGYQQGSPMKFAFNLEPFMLSLSIGEKDSPKVALKPLTLFGQPDVIQVRYASLYIAPTAVTIGTTTFPAGIGMGFQARIAGVEVNVLAQVDPVNLKITVKASVSRIKVGNVSLGPVDLDFLASKTEAHFRFSGTMHLGPGSVDIGPALKVGGELEATVKIEVEIGPKPLVKASFNGKAALTVDALVAQSACYYVGFLPYPCNFQWKRWVDWHPPPVDVGFQVDADGIRLAANGYSITVPWQGPTTTASADSDEAKARQKQVADDLAKNGTPTPDASATAAVVAAPATGTDGAAVRAASAANVASDPTGSPVLASSVPAKAPATAVPPPPSAAVEGDGGLTAATPEPSDQPMASEPLPPGIVPAADALLGGLPVFAPADGGAAPADPRPSMPATTVSLDDSQLAGLAADELGSWRATGAPATSRAFATVASLPGGRVLVAGGGDQTPMASAERYDPTTETWSAAESMHTPRAGATSVTLPDGRVLVVGGTSTSSVDGPGAGATTSVELYDPATGHWTTGGSLRQARAFAASAMLPDGRVLVTGGISPTGLLASSEIYDPAAGTWSAADPMGTPRAYVAATALADGSVLVAGGSGPDGPLDSSEIFTPATGRWTPTASLPVTSMMETATRLPDGRVLVVGTGANGMLYDPTSRTWSKTGALGAVRAQAASVLLPDGKVMIIGGTAAAQTQQDAEIYDPATNAWQATTDLPAPTAAAGAVVLPSGAVLVVGGTNANQRVETAALFNAPATPAPVPPPDVAPTPYAPPPPLLPPGGSDVVGPVALALALIAIGLGLERSSRRRRGASPARSPRGAGIIGR
jgi:hypothetical protein